MPPRAHDDSPDPSVDWVSASDISSRAYCARAFFLARVRHVAPDAVARPRLKQGTEHHRTHGRTYAQQVRTKHTALVILAGTMLLAFVLWLLSRSHL